MTWFQMENRRFALWALSDFSDAMSKVPPQKGSERYGVGVSDSSSDLFHAVIRGLQEVHRALHAQLLEIRQGRLSEDGLHAASQCSSARSGGCRSVVERKSPLQTSARPALEALNEWIRVRQMIDENIGRLRGPRVHHQIFCRQGRKPGAFLPDEPQGQVHMTQRGPSSNEFSGFYDHLRFVETHLRVPLAK